MWDYSAASRRCWDRMGIGETQLEGEKFMGYTINNAIFGENP
jgi:hypothetical protein